jgi:hypothetical protein
MTTSVVHLSEKELKAAVGSLKGSKKAVAREVLRRRREESRQAGYDGLIASIPVVVAAVGALLLGRRRTSKFGRAQVALRNSSPLRARLPSNGSWSRFVSTAFQ